jgi:hypothetical protein
MENLEKVLRALGYKENQYRFGSVIESFLSDNPGAADSIIDWICEQNIVEWKEGLRVALTKADDGKSDEDEAA